MNQSDKERCSCSFVRPQNCETKCSHPLRCKSIKWRKWAIVHQTSSSHFLIDLLQAPSEGREKMSSNPASWKLSKKVSSIFLWMPFGNLKSEEQQIASSTRIVVGPIRIFHIISCLLHKMRPAEEDELGPVWHQGGRRSREVPHLQQVLLVTSELKWRCVVNQPDGSLDVIGIPIGTFWMLQL